MNVLTKQSAWGRCGSDFISVDMPCPDSSVMRGVQWGSADELLTAAFWKYQSYMRRIRIQPSDFCIGRNLMEEVAVCLLGGYGMPAEIGLAAFERLQQENLLDGNAPSGTIEERLAAPFNLSGRERRYRFPRQKARYLSASLKALRNPGIPTQDVELRDFLTSLPGIGPKTASWVVRNHMGSDNVAILDVHIVRAGVHIGLYPTNSDPSKKYREMEERFIEFCRAIEEPTSLVDAIMWDFMRRLGPIARTQSHLAPVQ